MRRILTPVLALILFCLPVALGAQESVTITTYYPSPYGVYKNLRIFPSDEAPPACNANNTGLMYFSGNFSGDSGSSYIEPNGMYYCNGANWTSSGGLPVVDLGTFMKNGDFTLLDYASGASSKYRGIPNWDYIFSGTSYLRNRIDCGAGSDCILRLDMTKFGYGMYQITWDATLKVDAVSGQGARLRLSVSNPDASPAKWYTVDTSDLCDDDDGLKDGNYADCVIGPRSVTLNIRKLTRYDISITAAKTTNNNAKLDAIIENGAYFQVSRVTGF